MNIYKRIQFLKKFAENLSKAPSGTSSYYSQCEHYSNVIQNNLHKLFNEIYERQQELKLKKQNFENKNEAIPKSLNKEIEELNEKLSTLRNIRLSFYKKIYEYFN